MQSLIMLFLCISYCFVLCSKPEIDGSIRVRHRIRKLRHNSRNDAKDKTRWRQMIINEIAAPRAKSLMKKSCGLSSGSFKTTANSCFLNTNVLQNSKYRNHSMRAVRPSHLHVPSSAIAPFYGNDGSRHGFGKTNRIGMPWERVMQLPKISVGYRPTKFRTNVDGNSNEIALAASGSNLNSTLLLPHHQQRHISYQYKKQLHTAAPFSPTRAQQYATVKSPSLYYNPWDPLGLLNNPFWKSIFPNLFAPQPQLFVPTTPKPTQKGLALPKQSSSSPNEKLALCCRKQNLSPSCQILCNYDAFTERSLVTAVISNQCPGYELEMAFNCATSRADHSVCCIRNGISEYGNGHCMVFCTTHLGNPRNTLQYIDCLQVFDRIKNCYREYHVVNPNIYGDL